MKKKSHVRKYIVEGLYCKVTELKPLKSKDMDAETGVTTKNATNK